MKPSIITQDHQSYKVSVPVFEGPLDLLLQLIERAELDITKLALAQVTDQYLEYMQAIPEHSADDVSEFLAIAAKLIQIKSETLLPRPPHREQGEEDPGATLAQQLMLYKKFKECSVFLGKLESENVRTYPRVESKRRIQSGVEFLDLTLEELLNAAILVFSRKENQQELGSVVTPPRVTIRDKISLIADYLRQHKQGTFKQLLPLKPLRVEIVITFLALLELVKQRLIKASQDDIFGEIVFEADEVWDSHENLQIEFEE